MYGQCVGDAVGLATEFLTKSVSKFLYPSAFAERTYKHKDRRDDEHGHAARWETGAFTDDSDQMILALQTLLESEDMRPDPRRFMEKLSFWISSGFVDAATGARIKRPMGIGQTVFNVVSEYRSSMPRITTAADAYAASRLVWLASNGTLAANGAVMRTSVLAVPHFLNLDAVEEDTIAVSRTTHYDPRCALRVLFVTTPGRVCARWASLSFHSLHCGCHSGKASIAYFNACLSICTGALLHALRSQQRLP